MKNTTKRLIGILLATAMIITLCIMLGAITVGAAPTQTTDKYDVTGDGVNDTVYEIRTIDDFIWYYTNSSYSNRLNAILMNDLDLSTVCSETLGSWAAPTLIYLGVFDGNGKTIKNLYINTPDEESKGLFGQVYMGTIQNLTVTGSVTARESAAGFIGRGDVSIYNSVNYVNVTVTDRQGAGFIGYQSSNSVIDGCINYGTISCTGTNTATIGGIVGSYYGKITNCVNFGAISAPDALTASGIAGSGYYTNTLVENCINLGTVTARAIASEITAECDIVNNCYYKASSTNDGVYENSDATVTNVVAVSDTELTDGSLAYTLGESWGQEIGVDTAPVFGGMKVYYTMDPATLCTAATPTYYYANSENTKVTHDESMPVEDYESGFCPICGGYQPAVDGDGDGYYEIGNAGQLYWFAAQVNGGSSNLNAELVANITVNNNVLTASGDLNGNPEDFRAWTPIGISDANDFEGTFQGNGYVISGLYAKDYGVGFIKKTGSGAKIYNLGVMDSYFLNDNGSGHGYASGAIAGYLSGYSIVVENCFSNATIAGNSYISGGLIGSANSYPTIKNCYYFGKTVGSPFSHIDFSWNSKSGTNYYVSTTDDGIDYTTAITMEDVTSGKLAYMLGGAFGQNIDNGATVQSYPVINGAKVYYGYTTCDEAQSAPIYTNSDTASATKPAHHDFVYAANGNEITKHCGECNKLMGTVTVTATDGRYTGLSVSAAVSGTGDYAGESFVVTYTDDEGNSIGTAPTEIGSYTASVEVDGVSAFTAYAITKGVMSVSVGPTAKHEYGDTHLDKIISGKVVADGNDALEITGTWAWVGDTTTAIFTPDAEFVDLFEDLAAQSVTITVVEATPIITVTSPSPSIMPGMSIMLNIEFKNPHTDTPESLPASYRYVYKIGESGTLQYSSAVKLTIPSDVTVGETIYVYVESTLESGKYAAAQSNTVEILVGQVSYTDDIDNIIADLDAAKADLQSKIDTKADATALADAIATLNGAIANAQTAAESFATSADATLKGELESEIAAAQTTLQTAIDGVKAELDAAKADLQSKIDTKADATALADAIATLNGAIANAQTAAESFATSADATLKGELESEIAAAQTTLQTAIDGVKAELDAAKADLQSKIDTKADATALADAIATLNGAIADAQTAAESFATSADATLKGELESEIAAAQTTLQTAIDGVKADLDAAKADLQSKIDTKADATALADAIATLNGAIANAQTAAESFATSADATLKGELESEIAAAQTTLQTAIDGVKADLDAAVADLQSKIDANDDKLDEAVENLKDRIKGAKGTLQLADALNREELEAAIESAQGTLEDAIEAVEEKLDAAIDELKALIEDGNSASASEIASAVAKLNANISAAEAAVKAVAAAADEALNDRLLGAIEGAKGDVESAMSSLEARIMAELDAVKKAEAAANESIKAEMSEMAGSGTVLPTVVAFVAIAFCVGLLIFIIVDRKRA